MIAKQQLLTIKEVAQRLRISKSLAYKIIVEEGRIRHHRIGGRNRGGKVLVGRRLLKNFC
jgi:excisionase family DNA binding protein